MALGRESSKAEGAPNLAVFLVGNKQVVCEFRFVSEPDSDRGEVAEGGEEVQSWQGKVGAMATLALVLGFLWLVFQYLPTASDWLAGKTTAVLVSEEEGKVDIELPVEPSKEVRVPLKEEKLRTPVRSASALDYFRTQLVEQWQGEGEMEVRHLALSDDETRMVAALQIRREEEISLVEVYLERDEFGRYLSKDDSELGFSFKIWSP